MTWSARELRYHLGPVFVPDFQYVAHWYARIREFLPRASESERSVIFDADA